MFGHSSSLFLAQVPAPAPATPENATPPTTPTPPTAKPPPETGIGQDIGKFVTDLGFDTTWNQTSWTGWVALLVAIFLGLLIGKLLSIFVRRIGDRLERHNRLAMATVMRSAVTPISILAVTIGLSLGLGGIAMTDPGRNIIGRILTLLYVISVGWFLYNLVDLVDLWLRQLTAKTASTLDDQLAPLIRKTLRIFLVVLIVLFIAQNVFGQNITAWLAGLGIAGLAVSLAAQDSIKNLFGSITVILDRPFNVGDRIIFDGFDGSVEEIGFRSTRIRTGQGEVVTIPNSKFIDGSVRNVNRRPNILKAMDISVEYGTSPDKMRRAVELVRQVMAEPGIREGFDWAKTPPRVYFDEMRADSLNIKVQYWFTPVDWWAYMEHLQKLNLRIMEVLSAEGIGFAFPTRTMVLTNEAGKPLQVQVEALSGEAAPPSEPAAPKT